jgi:uncharacterized membrane protein
VDALRGLALGRARRDDLGGPLGWDLGFLAFGVLLVAVGYVLARETRPG